MQERRKRRESWKRAVKRRKALSRNVSFKWRWFLQSWKKCPAYVPKHSPVNTAVAHDDVCGSQTWAELRGHGEQPHSRSPAGGVLTGSSAPTTDEALHQTVQLLQSIKGAHQLGRHSGRWVSGVQRGRNALPSCMMSRMHERVERLTMRCLRSLSWLGLCYKCSLLQYTAFTIKQSCPLGRHARFLVATTEYITWGIILQYFTA